MTINDSITRRADRPDADMQLANADSTSLTIPIPNCLYIGTSKAGSTWIFDLLSRHSEVYAASGKGLYFFDSHYDQGLDWYLKHFENATLQRILLEISHSYLYSTAACQRIYELNPDMKLLVCLREPVDRTFSDYLDHVKNGKFSGSFSEAIEQLPSIVERSRYATHLRPYLERFGRQQIHVGVFDELAGQPQQFADQLFQFLGVPPLELSTGQGEKIMPAGRARSRLIMNFTKSLSKRLKRIGLKPLMGRIKRSRVIRNLLYRPYEEAEKPKPTLPEIQKLRSIFCVEVKQLDAMLGTNLATLWKYNDEAQCQ